MNGLWKKFTGHLLPSEENAYRPRILSRPWLLFFLTLVLTSEAVVAGSFIAGQSVNNFLAAVVPGEVIALTNGERVQNGVGILSENTLLDAAAQHKANDMAAKGYFSHVSPDDTQPWAWIAGAGYDYQDAGENLAVRFENSSDVVDAWMASPTHRANIVKPIYTEIGVGVATGTYEGTTAVFVVQYFGTPAATISAIPATNSSIASESESAASSNAQAAVAGASTQQKEEVPSTTPPAISSPKPEVEGASQSQPSITQQFLKAAAKSGGSASWILTGIATLLILILIGAFFMHIQIQPTDMLLGGAFVALVAIAFLALNASVLSPSSLQSASVFQGSEVAGVVGAGASIEK